MKSSIMFAFRWLTQVALPIGVCYKYLWRNQLFMALLLAHLVFASVLTLRGLGYLQTLELTAYDLMLAQHAQQQPINQHISLIWLTDSDQREWGWPLSDEHLAQALENLLRYKPRAIGLDLYRDMPVPYNRGAGYERLEKLLREHPSIVGIMKFGAKDGALGADVAPPPALKGTDQITFNDVTYDPGYLVRRGLLFMDDGLGNWYEYFGLKLVNRYAAQDGIYLQNLPEGMGFAGFDTKTQQPSALHALLPPPLPADFGGYVESDLGGYQFLINYPGAPQEFPSATLTQVLQGEFDPKWVHDKIVIIGTRAEATPDFLSTPYGRWLKGEQRIAGAAVHAYATSQLLSWMQGQATWLKSWDETEEQIWIWFWCVLGALACVWTNSFGRLFALSLGGLLLLGGGVYLAFELRWWLLLVAPALGWLAAITVVTAYDAYRSRHERTALMNIFSKHVSKEVANVIWESRDQYLNDGRLVSQRLTATVLFTDLQNFTTVSEAMEPQVLMDWLNQYMSTMVKIIEDHHGQVNKFIGDAVMAVFGVPIPSANGADIARDARNAVNCALVMRTELEQLRQTWAQQGLPLIRMRVGIFTGPLIAGSLGSEDRQEYTVLGDTVNIAARLESFDKTLDAENACRILIGDSTLHHLDEHYQTESVGTVQLKGKTELVGIHLVHSCQF